MRNLKRAIALAVASVMTMSMMVVGAGALNFKDADDIENVTAATVLEALEIMIGDDEGNFNPDKVVSRAEMATILCRVVYGVNYDASNFANSTTFADVDGHWAENEIGMAYAYGWINGRDAATFDPNATVSTYEAALMLQRGLGYYTSNDTTSYDLPTKAVSLANQLGMFNGVSAATYAGLTRDEVAVAVYNTLFACSPVAYSTFTTEYYVINPTNDKDGNNVNASIWTPAHTTYVDFGAKGTFAADIHDVEIVASVDMMGRPVDSIKVDGDEVATSPIAADAIFGSDTDYADVIDGTYADDHGVNGSHDIYVLNGSVTTNVKDLFDGNDYNKNETILGLVVEVYDEYDAAGKDEQKSTLLVAYYHYVDEIADLDYDDDDDKTTVKFSSASTKYTFDGNLTESFEEDDVVMYTINAGDKEIETMVLAEAVEGEVTGISSGDTFFYLDGTKYTNAKSYLNLDDALEVGDEATLYLNPYGYVIATNIITATESANDYLYVTAAAVTGGVSTYVEIEAYFADGTSAIVVVSELDDEDIDDVYTKGDLLGNVYSFSVDSKGYYELTTETAVTKSTVDAYVEGGYTRLTNGSGSTGHKFEESGIYFTDDTVFVDTENGVIYVGYENVADIQADAGNMIAVYDDGDVVVVFIMDGSASSEAGTYVYMDSTDYYTTKIDGDTYYVFTDAYLNGETYKLIADTKTGVDTGVVEVEVDSNGYVTKFITATSSMSDNVAKFEYVKTVGSASFTIDYDSHDERFEYDSNTVFVLVDADGDVSAAGKSDIVTSTDGSDDYTAVEVIYDDDDYAIMVFIYEKEV